MNITKNGVTIIVEDAEITRMVLERLNGSTYPDTLRGLAVPRIGEFWCGHGGIYAGLARGADGAPDYHLIVGPEFDGSGMWSDMLQWAAKVEHDGRRDFSLPFRREQALCFANVPELFKSESYWSCEQHASLSGNAWYQFFIDGHQYYWHEDYELRARAVRRLAI